MWMIRDDNKSRRTRYEICAHALEPTCANAFFVFAKTPLFESWLNRGKCDSLLGVNKNGTCAEVMRTSTMAHVGEFYAR